MTGRGRVTGMVALGAGLAAAAALSPRVVPYNMDEFVHYHALGCAAFPLSGEFNEFREGCGRDALRLPLTSRYLPLRSYLYIGSLPVVPFWPFWRVLRDPVAARVQGSVFFLAAALLASRLLGVRPGAVLLASAVFPLYPFAFLVDTGPVGISIVLLFASLLALRAALASKRQAAAAGWALASGLTAFLGIWVKLVFAWCLPALVLFGLFHARTTRWRRAAAIAGAWAVAFALPTLGLLAAETTDHRRYYEIVSVGRLSADPDEAAAVGSRLGSLVLHGAAVVPTTLQWPPIALDLLPALLAAAILARGVLAAATREAVGLWSLCAASVFAIAVSSGRADAPHHVVFAVVFLVLAMAAALDRLVRGSLWCAAVGAAVAVYWCSLAVRLPWAEPTPATSFGKDRLLAFVRDSGLDRTTVQLHASWGTYYIAHLFGSHEQVVLFSKKFPDSVEMLHEARALAASRGRGVLLVTRRPAKIHSDAVLQVLGAPRAVHRFENWWAAEFAW